ncbi:MAG TPA: hypothetical protein PKH93_03130 [Chitinophagales bacterium]|nr:hypothetical protein [Chitinophagales bacterium]
MALASAESNEAPQQSEARSSPTRRETPKKTIRDYRTILTQMERHYCCNSYSLYFHSNGFCVINALLQQHFCPNTTNIQDLCVPLSPNFVIISNNE